MKKESKRKIRYAVVGLGYISQVAVLPAFVHASKYCELTALVSSDQEKLDRLGKKYNIDTDLLFHYDQFEDCLNSGEIDAIYLALPNSMHHEYTIRAAAAKVHVLCEKPMALTENQCCEMIAACERNNVRLMIAYRLHFEPANMQAVEIVQSGKLGDLRIFNAVFTMNVREGNIRLQEKKGGGALYDIGIYCINAARYIFQQEPVRVSAIISNPKDKRFNQVDGLTSVLMEFGHGEIASFAICFGSADVSRFEIVGTKGSLMVDPAFEYATSLKLITTINGKKKEKEFKKHDQFAPELMRFAQCITNGVEPEPSGREGLADIRIIKAIFQSAEQNRVINLSSFEKSSRPHIEQAMKLPAISKQPKLIKVEQPTL